MAFTLNIRLAGMCMLVREPDNSALHVLMPRVHAPGHSGADVHQHFAQLLYDVAHETKDARKSGTLRPWGLEDRALHFVGLNTSEQLFWNGNDHNVLNLGKVVNQTVARGHIDTNTAGGAVLSRLVLPAGQIVRHDPGARWTLDGTGESTYMTIWVNWQVRNVNEDHLDLEMPGLNGDPTPARPRLYPIGGAIDLYVYHAPEEELPDTLPPPQREDEGHIPDEVEHFRCFYHLLGGPAGKPIPHRPEGATEEAEGDRQKAPMGSQVTCILASAEAEPS